MQEYSDGTRTWGELRLPDEVGSPESLASVAAVPVTIAHKGGMVTPQTWRAIAHGHAGDRARFDGTWVCADLVISSAEAIEAATKRELVEISGGYACKLEATSGVYEGRPYDAIQREIRYNHFALLPAGHARAGSDARLRFDSSGSTAIAIHIEDYHMKPKFRIDAAKAKATLGSRDFDLSKDADRRTLVQAINAEVTTLRQDMIDPAEIMDKLKDLQGFSISLTEGILALMEALAAEAEAPAENMEPDQVEEMVGVEAMDAAVERRARVVAKARSRGIETEGKSSAVLRREVLDKCGVRTDGLDAKTVTDFYDRIPEVTFDAHDRAIVGSGPAGPTAIDLDKARKEANARRANAWKHKSA